MEPPTVTIASPEEYTYWNSRLSRFRSDRGGEADERDMVNARLNYRDNRITLYRLADPSDEVSVVGTLSHETLHSLLYQMEELRAARLLDVVGKAVGNPERVGGI